MRLWESPGRWSGKVEVRGKVICSAGAYPEIKQCAAMLLEMLTSYLANGEQHKT